MAKISDRFAGTYVRTEDIDRKGMQITITDVVEEEIGTGKDAKEKLVLYCEELEKGIVLNKTNATELADHLGDDTDDWNGKTAYLKRSTTMFQGKKTDCLRLAPTPAPTGSPPTSTGGTPTGSPTSRSSRKSDGAAA